MNIIKEYKEQVLDKESTHAIVRKVGDEIVYDLVIKSKDENGNDVFEYLATDRTFQGSGIELTPEELEKLNGNNS